MTLFGQCYNVLNNNQSAACKKMLSTQTCVYVIDAPVKQKENHAKLLGVGIQEWVNLNLLGGGGLAMYFWSPNTQKARLF